MLSRSYWQILPGGQYPTSPRGKVAFALHQNRKQEGGGEGGGTRREVGDGSNGQGGEARSISAVERIDDNHSISSSSASSTFSPGEEDVPPFLNDQRGHLHATPPNGQNPRELDNLQFDAEQFCENKHQTPTFSSDENSANISSEREARRSNPSIENVQHHCYEENLQSRKVEGNYDYYESNESQSNAADSDSILSCNNNWNNGGTHLGKDEPSPALHSGIQSMQGRKCSLSESRVASASTLINSTVISSRIFNPETLDSSVMMSQ